MEDFSVKDKTSQHSFSNVFLFFLYFTSIFSFFLPPKCSSRPFSLLFSFILTDALSFYSFSPSNSLFFSLNTEIATTCAFDVNLLGYSELFLVESVAYYQHHFIKCNNHVLFGSVTKQSKEKKFVKMKTTD